MNAATATPAALSLRVNMAWTLVGNLAQAAAQWAVVVVLARMGNVETVGAYALALAIVSPVFLFANMHLRTVLSTDVTGETGIGVYFSLRLATSAATLCLLLAAALYWGGFEGFVLAGLALAKAFEAISELLYGELQRQERMDRIGKSMILRAVGSLAAVAAAMRLTQNLPLAVFSMAVISAAVAASDMRSTGVLRMSGTLQEIKRLAVSAAPLGLLLLLVSLNAAIPRYFLAGMASPAAVGVFAALSYVSIALNTLVMAAGQASGASMARSFWSRDASAFLRKSSRLVGLSIVLGLAGLAAAATCGEDFLLALYGPAYAAEHAAFLWLMAAGAVSFAASALGYAMSAARCFLPQVPTLAATAVVTAICCRLWVPQSGVAGAAMAQTSGFAAQLLLSLWLLGYFSWRKFQ